MGTPQKSLAASVENDLRREAIEIRIEGEVGNQDRPMSWLHRDPVSPFGEIRRKWIAFHSVDSLARMDEKLALQNEGHKKRASCFHDALVIKFRSILTSSQ